MLGCWILLACCCLAAPHYDAAAARAGLAGIQGTVETRLQTKWVKAQAGDLLVPGQAVRTGPKSIAVVVLDDLTSLRLGANSELSIVSLEEGSGQASLASGRVWVNANPGGAKTTFELRGPNAVAAVKGTSFEMSVAEGRTLVRVWEGNVLCQQPAASRSPGELLAAGKEYTAGVDTVQVLAANLSVRDAWQTWNQDCDRQFATVANTGLGDDGAGGGGGGGVLTREAGKSVPARPPVAISRRPLPRPSLKLSRRVLQTLGSRLPQMPILP